ncbi:uncharacterized protein LOC124159736 [Ischnura elegans]|uniref:uncharacterized protein LOC124159736 n=1 Tax=Ischnura elegans TaxID=197161 RepID=UPI001ED8A5ED|nr:uncharacterized protein LOC124159736 [Ischnura elegans]
MGLQVEPSPTKVVRAGRTSKQMIAWILGINRHVAKEPLMSGMPITDLLVPSLDKVTLGTMLNPAYRILVICGGLFFSFMSHKQDYRDWKTTGDTPAFWAVFQSTWLCLALGLTPKYVTLTTASKSPAAKIALETARRTWIRKELQSWYMKRDSIAQYRFRLHLDLCRELSWTEWTIFDDYVRQRSSEIAHKKRLVLMNKLKNLTEDNHVPPQKPRIDVPANCFYNRVVNLSNVELNEQEIQLLEKGFKYVPDLPIGKRELENLIIDCDAALFNSNRGHKSVFSHKISNAIKRINPTAKQFSSDLKPLKSVKKLLREENLIIEKADKGNAVVVMGKVEYAKKCNDFIENNPVVELPNDPTYKFQKLLKKALNSAPSIIKTNEMYKVTVMNPQAPRFFGLPKLHKTNIPIRPVVSSVAAPSRKLASHLNSIFREFTGFKPRYGVNNSTALCRLLTQREPPPSKHTLVSFDVKDLFTNIPISEAVKIAEETLRKAGADPPFLDDFVKLLTVCVEENYFKFNNKFYRQKEVHSCSDDRLADDTYHSLDFSDVFTCAQTTSIPENFAEDSGFRGRTRC